MTTNEQVFNYRLRTLATLENIADAQGDFVASTHPPNAYLSQYA